MKTSSLYAVFGRPIKHTLSPQIHQLFAKEQGIGLTYEARLVESSLENAVQQFVEQGGVGANVTLTFKVDAFKLCGDRLSEPAKVAGAVNTLIRLPNENTWYGDNTDGAGLMMDLQRLNVLKKNMKVLIIGAGGAARGVISPLQSNKATVFIHNRTIQKAVDLADEFGCTALKHDELKNQSFDIVINATSASLEGKLPDIPEETLKKIFCETQLAYDMFYDITKDTKFVDFAKKSNCKNAHDGLGMLVGQAAKSYELWQNFEPNIDRVLQELRPEKSNKLKEQVA